MPSLSEYHELLSNLNLPPNSVLIELEYIDFHGTTTGPPTGHLWDYQVFYSWDEQPRAVGNANEKYMSDEAQNAGLTGRGGQAITLRGSWINEPGKYYVVDIDYVLSPDTINVDLSDHEPGDPFQEGTSTGKPFYYDDYGNYTMILAHHDYDIEINGAMDQNQQPTGSLATADTPGWFRANTGIASMKSFNPIVEVGLMARTPTLANPYGWIFENSGEPYIGPYHLHHDGTAMIGEGVLTANHEINPDEVIIQYQEYSIEQMNEDDEERPGEIPDEKLVYTTPPPNILSVREKVSDLFYKIWFESNTLSDNELLSLQTTIRDGKKQSGRTEDEPLVFYKKDRNTLENRKDIVGDKFEQMCQYIFNQEITELENYLQLTSVDLPSENENDVVQYKIIFDHGKGTTFDIDVAKKVGDTFTDILNLSQLTVPKFGSRIDADRAREILDTNIFELLPNQTTRQDQVNNFFTEFDNLIGPTPIFQDVDGDGVGEDIQNKEQDEQSRRTPLPSLTANLIHLL